MSPFSTLMRREWMQHQRAWLLLMLLPPLLLLLLLVFGNVDLPRPVSPLLLMLVTGALGTFGVLAIFSAATLLQLPGLARRDQQDRSIEFWLSLPTGHAPSIGAMLLMHLLVMPLVALGVGYVASQALGFVIVVKTAGLAAWAQLPWGLLLRDELLVVLSFAFGVLLATLWLLPLLLLTMAASAWLKRWGTAALGLALGVGHALLAQLYGVRVIGTTIEALIGNAMRAVINTQDARLSPHDAASAADWLEQSPRWLWQDATASAANLFQPLFVFALLFAAACFGLLVLRRRRQG